MKNNKWNKRCLSTFVIMVTALIANIGLIEPVSAENVIFEDNFESYDVGNYPCSPWYIIFSGSYGAVSTEKAYSGTKSFKTQGQYGWSRSDAIPLNPIKKIGYEVSIYPMGQDAMLTLNNRGVGSWGSHDANIYFTTDGHIYGGGIDLGTYNINQWYTVRVNADFDSQVMDIYINGLYKGTGTAIGEYPLAPGEVRYNSLALESRWESNPGIYYDDVKVFDLTSTPANLEFDQSSTSIIAINNDAKLKVHVTDQSGNPVEGANVEFSSNPSGLIFTDVTNPTDSYGYATVTATTGSANVYTVTAKVTGTEIFDTWTLVVFNPNGMTAGGGWYYPLDDSESSMPYTANFGFIAKIKDSSATGNLEFQYHVEDKLNLKSTSIAWLVVSNGNAQFKGTAALNGETGYYFRVIAKDNGEPGVGSDWFSIKIWKGDPDNDDSTLIHSSHNILAGGNIMVKTK